MSDGKFSSWAIVDLMGHTRLAGYVTEREIAGAGLLQIDVPQCGERPAFSRFVAPTALYSMTPVSEEVARQLASTIGAQPITVWDLPDEVKNAIRIGRNALPAPVAASDDDEDYDELPM